MKKAVIFDLGNVLIDVNNVIAFPSFKTHLKKEYSHEELDRILYGHNPGSNRWEKTGEETKLFEQYHLGLITTKDFFEAIRKKLDFSDEFSFEEFKKIWPNRFTKKDDVVHILPYLKNHQRYLLSDTNDMDATWIMNAFPDIFTNFDKLFLSHETKADKYGSEAWNNILKYSTLPPSSHVFIDDHEGHVERAKKIGFQGIIFTDAKQLWNDLEKLGYL